MGNQTPASEEVMAKYHKIMGTGEAVPGCENCGVECGDNPCEDCRKKIAKEQAKLARDKKEREERWEAQFKAKEAVKRRKFEAECAAIQKYWPEISRCKSCSEAKKTKGKSYCDVRLTKINDETCRLLTKY
jgi:hypothetical protein